MSDCLDQLALRPRASEIGICSIPHSDRLPRDYIDFLRKSDGAYGFLNESYVILLQAEEILSVNTSMQMEENAPGLVVFASDGGGVSYCFDTNGPDTKVVEIASMDIGFENPKYCSDSFLGFIRYLCVDSL